MDYRVNECNSVEGERVEWTASPPPKTAPASKGSGRKSGPTWSRAGKSGPTWIIAMLIFLVVNVSVGQPTIATALLDPIDQTKFQKMGRKILLRTLRDDPPYSSNARRIVKGIDVVAIPSFIVSSGASSYDGLSPIWQYLVPNKEHPLEYVLALKDSTYFGGTNCLSAVNFGGNEEWYFDDTGKDGSTFGASMARSWEKVIQHRPDFIFSVRYFRMCWWLVVNDQVLILELDSGRIYRVEEYVKDECRIEAIQQMAMGKRVLCN